MQRMIKSGTYRDVNIIQILQKKEFFATAFSERKSAHTFAEKLDFC